MTDLYLSAQVRDSFKSSFLLLIENEKISIGFGLMCIHCSLLFIKLVGCFKELSLKINKAQRDMVRSAMI